MDHCVEKVTTKRTNEEIVKTPTGKTPTENTAGSPQKLSPICKLAVGEFNRLFVRYANGEDGGSSPVRVQNRYGKGMGHSIVLNFESGKNGIGWEEPGRVYMQGCREREDGVKATNTMSLCKMIVTNRLVFGSSIATCPFEVDPEPYTKQGYQYWVDAIKLCYLRASAAAKDVQLAAIQCCKQDVELLTITPHASHTDTASREKKETTIC
jgi:hypothetical protein